LILSIQRAGGEICWDADSGWQVQGRATARNWPRAPGIDAEIPAVPTLSGWHGRIAYAVSAVRCLFLEAQVICRSLAQHPDRDVGRPGCPIERGLLDDHP